jgi:hypothetical protein
MKEIRVGHAGHAGRKENMYCIVILSKIGWQDVDCILLAEDRHQ